LAQLSALASEPVVPLPSDHDRLRAFASDLHDERSLARPGYRIAMRGLLALIAVEVARLAANRDRIEAPRPTDATVLSLRRLIEEHFQAERQLAFYADKLAMTVDRLNDHVKRAISVTAGHLIRQRVLTEAKRQLVFTSQPINEIAYALAFSDPSHFARFFRKHTGAAPHEYRAARGG
jgi:AraC family transcriptional activator of pobA